MNLENYPKILEYLTSEKPCKTYNKEEVREEKIKSWVVRLEYISNNITEQIFFFQKFQPSKMLAQIL